MWVKTAMRDKTATIAREAIEKAEAEAKAKAQEERLEDTKGREIEVVVVSGYRKPRYRGYYGYWNPYYPSPHGHWKPRKPRRHGHWKPRHPRSHGRKLSPESFKNFSIR